MPELSPVERAVEFVVHPMSPTSEWLQAVSASHCAACLSMILPVYMPCIYPSVCAAYSVCGGVCR